MKWLFRLVLLIVAIAGLWHFPENPSGLTILIVLCVGISAFIRDEQLCAFETFWEKNNLMFFGLIKQKKEFVYKEIKSIQIEKDNSVIDKYLNETILNRYQIKGFEIIEIIKLDNSKILIKTKVDIITLRRFITVISNRLEKI